MGGWGAKMTHSLLAGLCALLAPVVLNAAETGKAKDDHDHDHAEHAGHDHDDKDHADHEGHDHAKKVAGPNGGKVIMNVEPHFELFVTRERKIQISFLSSVMGMGTDGAVNFGMRLSKSPDFLKLTDPR